MKNKPSAQLTDPTAGTTGGGGININKTSQVCLHYFIIWSSRKDLGSNFLLLCGYNDSEKFLEEFFLARQQAGSALV